MDKSFDMITHALSTMRYKVSVCSRSCFFSYRTSLTLKKIELSLFIFVSILDFGAYVLIKLHITFNLKTNKPKAVCQGVKYHDIGPFPHLV